MGNNKNKKDIQQINPKQHEQSEKDKKLAIQKQDIINKIMEVFEASPKRYPPEELQRFRKSYAEKDYKELKKMVDESEEKSKKRREEGKKLAKELFDSIFGDSEHNPYSQKYSQKHPKINDLQQYLEELDEIELVVKQFTKKSYSDIADWINDKKEYIKMLLFYETLSNETEYIASLDRHGLHSLIKGDTTLQREIIEVSRGYARYVRDGLEVDKEEIQKMLDFIENCNKNRKK